jgi:mRNA-degrading endonuclease RelE of RelBE toxin-antitoxin system
VEFIETPTFTKHLLELLSDDEYRLLQATLVQNPVLGPIIQGSGGIRKVRWALKGHGKRGGVRVIYYWKDIDQRAYMLLIYSKSEQDDITPSQVKILKRILDEE